MREAQTRMVQMRVDAGHTHTHIHHACTQRQTQRDRQTTGMGDNLLGGHKLVGQAVGLQAVVRRLQVDGGPRAAILEQLARLHHTLFRGRRATPASIAVASMTRALPGSPERVHAIIASKERGCCTRVKSRKCASRTGHPWTCPGFSLDFPCPVPGARAAVQLSKRQSHEDIATLVKYSAMALRSIHSLGYRLLGPGRHVLKRMSQTAESPLMITPRCYEVSIAPCCRQQPPA